MISRASILGRIMLSTEYAKASELLKQFRPMLRSPQYVSNIYQAVQEVYATEDNETRRQIFISSVYQLYQPLSFLPALKEEGKDAQAAGKLPAGVRDAIAACLGLNHPEEVNRFLQYASPWMRPFNTGPERPFRTKVMQIVERFRIYSVNREDTQYTLSL